MVLPDLSPRPGLEKVTDRSDDLLIIRVESRTWLPDVTVEVAPGSVERSAGKMRRIVDER